MAKFLIRISRVTSAVTSGVVGVGRRGGVIVEVGPFYSLSCVDSSFPNPFEYLPCRASAHAT